MKELNGAELAEFIKERQLKAVRGLKQAWDTHPKLAIIITQDDPVIDKYVSLKRRYADDILVDVEVYRIEQPMVPDLLDDIKKDKSIHGVILQLPLRDPSQTDELCALIPPSKDVDALGPSSPYDAATPTAINWLLSGYNVDLAGKQIAVVGQGKLVGKPMTDLLLSADLSVQTFDKDSPSLAPLKDKDIIITAAGKPGLITPDLLKPGMVIVDAGTSTQGGKLVGDVADEVYQLEDKDMKITPRIGGVGPLTIVALFENLLTAARGSKGELPDEA